MVKEPGNIPGEDSGAAGGSNVSRKEVSPFNDLIVSDIFTCKQCVAVYAKPTARYLR
jgi:hypothetical protein